MKKTWWWIALAGLLALAGVLMATFPAQLAWRWWGERAPDLKLNGVSGTVWNGQAVRASLRGHALGRLQWRIAPLSLLRGRPAAQLSLDGDGLKLDADLADAGEGRVRIEHLEVDADANWLAPALAIPALEPTGRLRVRGASLTLAANGWPEALEARIEWIEAGVRGTVVARLGTLMIDARGRDGRIQANIADGGDGEVEIRGSALIDQGSYRSEVVLLPRVAAGPVVEALRWIGEPRPEGGRLLRIEGRIEPTEVHL
ncbi:MAG: type II secretion system protein N [Xanthomonadales bacterium]|nr:hypothetical protein [Xanthomonadales bacterium]MCC6592438.1 type II secretion system protein N [Xanthomonadales bacterium]